MSFFFSLHPHLLDTSYRSREFISILSIFTQEMQKKKERERRGCYLISGFKNSLMTHHLCRGCVPGEVVHSRGGQVVLIVLRELLELVLVVREASVHAEVPADGRATG